MSTTQTNQIVKGIIHYPSISQCICFIVFIACLMPQKTQAQENDTSYFRLGGAVRFNIMYAIYEHETFPLPTENRNGVYWDVFRLDIEAMKNGIGLVFEYRFFPGFNCHFFKKGYMTYDFSSTQFLEIGITQVPFGMYPLLGNSWWFQLPYYLGYEDDYDTGVKYSWVKGRWTYDVAYFLVAEPRGVSDLSYGSFASARYSYDIIPEDGYNGNKERNQVNFRVRYQEPDKLQAGFSGEAGAVYNSNADKSTLRYALALHAEIPLSEKIDLKLQAIHYDHPKILDDSGVEEVDYVNVGAYGSGTYQMAASANVWSIGMSYFLEVNWFPIESFTFYNDYSFMNKNGAISIEGLDEPYVNSHHNILGFAITAGNVISYFDIAAGVNQPWLSDSFGGNALSSGRGESPYVPPGEDIDGDDSNGQQVNPLDTTPPLNIRFNINVGYYF